MAENTIEQLWTFDDGAARLNLVNADAFSRFCRKHGIPVVAFSPKMKRVRQADVEAAIDRYATAASAAQPTT